MAVAWFGKDSGQTGGAVQVGGDRDDSVEPDSECLPYHFLADGLTRRERDVLSHVGKVRGN